MCVLTGKGIESRCIIDHRAIFERSANADDFANDAVQLIKGGRNIFRWHNVKQAKT